MASFIGMYIMKHKKILIALTIVILLLVSFMTYYMINDGLFLKATEEYNFSCPDGGDFRMEEGKCRIKGWHTYHFDQTINNIIQLTIHVAPGVCYDRRSTIYVQFQINDNWIQKATFGHSYCSEKTEIINFASFSAAALRFRSVDIWGNVNTFGGSDGSLLTKVPEGQCDLTVYVEKYSDGPPVDSQKVNVRSQPSGAVDLTEYTNDDGFAFFTLDYGAYVITVGGQHKTVNLNIPTWYETFTLTEPPLPETIDIWPYLLLLLILVMLFFGSIYYFKSKKTKEKK